MLKNGKGEIVLKARYFIGIIVFLVVSFSYTSYAIMPSMNIEGALNLSYIHNYDVKRVSISFEKEPEVDKEIQFVSDTTGLTIEEAEYLLNQCEEKNLDLFLVLGLMKLESNFDKNAVGTSGERGLGQLMENTAEPIAKNLGLEYEPKMLFEPEYNIVIFTTQLAYLKKVFKNNVHMTLTAYNRGQWGLEKYMASRSTRTNPARSTYSDKVIRYKQEYYNEYIEIGEGS